MRVVEEPFVPVAGSRDPNLDQVVSTPVASPPNPVQVWSNEEPPAPANPRSADLEAVRLYSLTGSLAKVSRELGVPLYELTKLTRTQWWQDELAALRREEMALTNASLTRVFDQTLAQIEDRLTNGDFTVSQGGALRRVPVSASTLARLADMVFDKRQLVRNEPTIIAGDNDKLARLADKLRRLGAARTLEAGE